MLPMEKNRNFSSVIIGELELTTEPDSPVLWLLDEFYYNNPISNSEIKRLLMLKTDRDLVEFLQIFHEAYQYNFSNIDFIYDRDEDPKQGHT